MKLNYSFIFLLMFLFFSCASVHVKHEDVMKKNRVLSETRYQYNYSEDGKLDTTRHRYYYATYNDKGFEVMVEEFDDSNRIKLKRESYYDEKGNISLVNDYFYSDTTFSHTEKYVCRADGKPTEMSKYDLYTGKFESKTKSEFDANGNCTKMIETDSAGIRTWLDVMDYDGSGNLISSTIYSRMSGWDKSWRDTKMEYDHNGNETKSLHYDENGKLVGYHEKKYDEKGLLTSWIYYTPDDKPVNQLQVVYTFY